MSEPTNDNESEQPEGQARRPALSFGDDNTSQLPHWSEPATGEVPVFGTSRPRRRTPPRRRAGRGCSPAARRPRTSSTPPSPTDVFRPVDEGEPAAAPASAEPGDQPGEDSAWAAPTWAGEDEVAPGRARPHGRRRPPGRRLGLLAGDETRPIPVIADAGPTAQPGDETEPHDDDGVPDQETDCATTSTTRPPRVRRPDPGSRTPADRSGEVAGAAAAGAALTGGAAVAGAARDPTPVPPPTARAPARRRAGRPTTSRTTPPGVRPRRWPRPARLRPSRPRPSDRRRSAAAVDGPARRPVRRRTPSWQDEVIWPAESLSPTNPESERLIFGEDMDEPVQVGRGRWSAGAARDMAFGADPGDGERNLSIAVGVGLVLAGAPAVPAEHLARRGDDPRHGRPVGGRGRVLHHGPQGRLPARHAARLRHRGRPRARGVLAG